MNINLINSNINLTTTNDYVPVVYANLLINGYAGIVVNKKLAYRTLLDSAYYGNNFAILEIVKDFVSDRKIDVYFKYPSEILLDMANKLYESFKEEDFIEENAINYLIMFFNTEPYVNMGFANNLITQGLSENNFHVIMLFAEYNLYGNYNLKIKQNVDIAIEYYQQLLSMDNDNLKQQYKNNILNLLGLALTVKLEEFPERFKLAEQYLLEAYKNKVDYAGYNLACLYFKASNFSASFELLSLEHTKNPFDIDVLCDLGIHYLCGTGVEQDLELAKEYMYRACGLGSKRAVPNLIILKLLEVFLQNKLVNFKELMEYQKTLGEYVASNAIYNYSNTCKSSIFLLKAAISLMYQPFQYTLIINQLTAIETDMDYRVEFAVEYLKNKPKNKDINDLGFDLLLILISLECKSKKELAIKFKNVLSSLDTNKLDITENNCSNYNISQLSDWNSQTLRFKERLDNFINKNPKCKISFKDFKQICFTASKLYPEQAACKIKHASTGSGEKIEFISKLEDNPGRKVLVFHSEHRSGRSINVNDKHDPRRTKIIKEHAQELHNRIDTASIEHAKLCYNFSL